MPHLRRRLILILVSALGIACFITSVSTYATLQNSLRSQNRQYPQRKLRIAPPIPIILPAVTVLSASINLIREFVTTLMIDTKVNGSGTLTWRIERVFRIRFIEALKTVAAGRIIGIGGAIRSFFEGTADL